MFTNQSDNSAWQSGAAYGFVGSGDHSSKAPISNNHCPFRFLTIGTSQSHEPKNRSKFDRKERKERKERSLQINPVGNWLTLKVSRNLGRHHHNSLPMCSLRSLRLTQLLFLG